MDRFLSKHAEQIVGTLSCFDRLIFKGHLPLSWPKSMETFMLQKGLRFKDFGWFVKQHSEALKEHAQKLTERAGRPYVHLFGKEDKEDRARAIAAADGITQGLICVLATVEVCRTYRLKGGKKRPELAAVPRQCLCLYFYYIDRELGFLHVRLQTWFPFTIQVYVNGHEILARQMDRHGIAYRRVENAFTQFDQAGRVQRMADRLVQRNWPAVLAVFARRVNPLLKGLLQGMEYYWVIDEAEYATDVLFKNTPSLRPLYQELLRHATLCFGAEDVMSFLGRKLYGQFKGEVVSDCKRRHHGWRIKHRAKGNWIKMYDKGGGILRIETVINNPHEFRIRRQGKRNGQWTTDWFPMAKRVTNLYRYAEIARSANGQYLTALAVVEDPRQAQKAVAELTKPVRERGRSHRGFNPAAPDDVALFASVLAGAQFIHGFRNADIRVKLFGSTRDRARQRRQSATVSRLLKRLHARELIARVSHSRRWRVTVKGQRLMTMVVKLHRELYPQELLRLAA